MVPSFNTFVVLWNFGPAGLFASFLTLKQPFGHLIKALNGRYCNYESMQTNYISQFYFILSFVWQQSPKSQFCAENRHQKLHLFVVNFYYKKDLKGHTLVSTWNFFLCVIETRIVFLNLARSCWVIQSCWASQSYQRNISYTPPSLQGLQGVTWAYKGYRGYWDYNVRLQSYKIK